MKIAIIYFSKTGHSKKLAESIAKDLQIEAEDIKSKPVLDMVDLLFIVGGIYGGTSSPTMKEYVNNIDKNHVKKVALITNCLSAKQKQDIVREIMENHKIEVVPEEFICRGSLMFIGFGHPNKKDIASAISFTRKIISDFT